MEDLLLQLHAVLGNGMFLTVMGIISVVLSLVVIPRTTDMMVNSAAGLAGKHLGRQYRTLVINCSTNNPEVATMVVSFCFLEIGGIGTPLGSNFANIYLMFGVALGWVLLSLRVTNPSAFRDLIGLLGRERRLIGWHLAMSSVMFLVACFAFRGLTGQFPIGLGEQPDIGHPSTTRILGVALLCCCGVAFFVWRDLKLRRARPELYEEIDDSDHIPSWTIFFLGTGGLILACYAINLVFVVVTGLYGATLASVFGPKVFAVLHYFVGALVTSLPEMSVAIKNYRRVTSPDLNTALASATASNMSNLAIAAAGCVIASMLF